MKQSRADIVQFVLSVAIVLVLAFFGSLAYFKLDLTEERRHTLTQATEDLLSGLEDQVFVRVYLHGDFEAKWKRFEKSIQERLQEFGDVADNVEYEFIDIYESGDQKTIGENEEALWEQGLRFTNIYSPDKEGGKKSMQMVWPGAIVTYKGKSIPLQFYKSDDPAPTELMINNSINNLEFELASKIRQLAKTDKPIIAFLEGHRELVPLETADFTRSLAETYDITTVKIDGQIGSITEKTEQQKSRQPIYDLLIIAKPDSTFSQKDKIVLDQYIMAGGKVLWMIDPIRTDLDSLSRAPQTLALTNDIGLYDMLFDYGVKANRDLILDFQSDIIYLDAGRNGTQRNYQPFSWYFAPVTMPGTNPHPITSNLDPIRFDFVSSLEAVGNSPSVEKIPLLKSSELSKAQRAPVRINTSVVNFGIDHFQKGGGKRHTFAMLLDGEFDSNFKGRLNDTLTKDPNIAFREKSVSTKMIVIADGDIVKNGVITTKEGYQPLPLGYDRNTQKVIFDNKEFLLNCVNYLLDDEALISLRSRSIMLRKLDPNRTRSQRELWQFVNMALPLVLVLLLGTCLLIVRKKMYS